MAQQTTNDRRSAILKAGVSVLRKEGLSGFMQPNAAAKAGLRRGNPSYYFATRADLLAAVARTAIDLQLDAAKMLLRSAKSPNEATTTLGAVADQDPALQALFKELLDGFVQAIADFLEGMNHRPTQSHIDLLHAVFVELSVIDLATGRQNGNARALAVLKALFRLLSSHDASTKER